MAVLDHNEHKNTWVMQGRERSLGRMGLLALRGAMLVVATIFGLSAAIALDPYVNLFAGG